MTITALELSDKLNGTVEGKEEEKITHPAKIKEAGEGAVSFIANPKYMPYLQDTKASVLIVPRELKVDRPKHITFIRVDDAYNAFTLMLKIFAINPEEHSGISKNAIVDDSATIGKNVTIGHYAVVGPNAEIADGAILSDQVNVGAGAKVGKNSRLHAGVKIFHGCVIGNNCILHAGVVIGSDGFGFAPQKDGTYEKIPQTGNVVVSDDVEIGANSTIDRATMGSTMIGKGVKIDNLVQVAHNVEIGDYTVVAAQAGISGSTKIGKYCQVGGQAGFVGHIKIADRVGVNAQSGVSKSVEEPGAKLTDSPAWEYRKALRAQAVYRKLPEMEERLRNLEKLIISHSQENNE